MKAQQAEQQAAEREAMERRQAGEQTEDDAEIYPHVVGAAADDCQKSPPAERESVRCGDRVGCAVCGGKTVSIRGRYPGDEPREVCPTCLAETLDDLRVVLAGANHPAQEAQPTVGDERQPGGAA